MSSTEDFPKPAFITGGCLCGALRYRVDFPPEHKFLESCGTCQCTQCRRNTSSLMFVFHRIKPASKCFRFTSAPEDALKEYRASEAGARAFCGRCGSMMYWQPRGPDASDHVSLAVGTIDPLYLWGDGAGAEGDGAELEGRVPRGGFARALVTPGGHEFCGNEIPGVTDVASMVIMARGERLMAE